MIASSPVFLSHVSVMANTSHSCAMMSSFILSVLFLTDLALINATLGERFSQSLFRFDSLSVSVHVVDAALVVSGYKAGSTSNYWTNCTLAIATCSAPSCDRTSYIVLYRVEQRLRQLAASDTSTALDTQCRV